MSSPVYPNPMNEYDLLAFSVFYISIGIYVLIYGPFFKIIGVGPIIFGLMILIILAKGEK